MGYAISWIAFKDVAVAQVAEMLSLSPSGETEEMPESMFSGVLLDNGWYVVVINKFAHEFVSERSLRRVSAQAHVIAAVIEEHVMFSSAEAWKRGNRTWKIAHDGGDRGHYHLDEQGVLPEEYGSIKERLLAAQKQEHQTEPDVDNVFDIPLELAATIVGYKHDRDIDACFEILKPGSSAAGSGLLSRLFRRA